MTGKELGWKDDPFVLNALLLLVATSFAIALTSCLWHHIYTPHSSSISNQPLSTPQSTQDQRDRKSTRSKERRRRGKDPFRDLLKGGKKSKALLKAIKVPVHDTPLSVDTLSNPSLPSNDSASSTSRSHSPESLRDQVSLASSDHAEPDESVQNHDTSLASPATSPGHPDRIYSRPCSPESMTTMDTRANLSSASTVTGHDAPALAPSSPHALTPSVPQSRDDHTPLTGGGAAKLVRARKRSRVSEIDSGVHPALSTVDSVEISFPSLYPVAPYPSLSISSPTNHSTDGAGPSTPTNSRESTPPPRTPDDPTYGESHMQPFGSSIEAAETQLASLRDALEAARLREGQLLAEAEQASKERDELCWRWNEDAGVWRRREAELQAQIHHLVQQLQAYATAASFPSSGFSSPTAPHAHSPPRFQHHTLAPFPLPPAIQAQNSASAPAHVQALLASAPMLTSHPPGYAAPGGLYPGLGVSPLFWSGMGLAVSNRDSIHGGRRTPDSSASGSSSRSQRRQRRGENANTTSDESSLGDLEAVEDGSEDEDPWEEEDIFRNNALADAILKRPESIRDLNGSVRKRLGVGHGAMPGAEHLTWNKPGFISPPLDTSTSVQLQ